MKLVGDQPSPQQPRERSPAAQQPRRRALQLQAFPAPQEPVQDGWKLLEMGWKWDVLQGLVTEKCQYWFPEEIGELHFDLIVISCRKRGFLQFSMQTNEVVGGLHL